jgi:hypothetical protein
MHDGASPGWREALNINSGSARGADTVKTAPKPVAAKKPATKSGNAAK